MATYIITYDLMKPGQSYGPLIEKIKSFGNWCHLQQSVWMIKSSLTAVQVRDGLQAKLDSNDKLMVARIEGEAAWTGYSTDISNWVKTHA